jgi:tetratricopeptide (TPR) repeat protein
MAAVREILVEAVNLHKAGKLEQAEYLYRQVLREDPRQADALNLLGVIANQLGKPEAAIDFIRQAIATQPGEMEFHNNLASAYKAAGEVAAAADEYRQVLRLVPDHVLAHVYLSDALMEQGDLDAALQHSLEALRLEPDSALAHCTLGELVGQGCYTFSNADIQRMQTLLNEGRQSTHDASMLYFTLAAYWERSGDYDEAFRCYHRANELKGEVYRQSNKAFDPRQHLQLIDNLIAVFTPEFFARTRCFGSDSEIPVFVVGMVRSGTSLVEQILASHPQGFGVGELKDIDKIANVLPGRLNSTESYPNCASHIDPVHAKTLAYLYLQRLANHAGAAIRVVDKMPHNYLHLGLIAVLFPRSRIVHCKRDTMDVCASTYFQNFKWLPYASSIENIAFYYRQYERLMAHWRQVLPIPMQEVIYEDLVADQEAVSRQLLAFCGLDWDDRCLSFHTSPRAVKTASKLQVRQPIYTRSVARWKRFEAHLRPLRDALGESTALDHG